MSDVEPSNTTDILRSDAEYLMQCPKELIKELGWNWKTPIHEWRGVKVGENQRIISLNLRGKYIDDEGAKGLVLPPGLQELDLWDNNIGAEGAKGLVLPPGLKSLWLNCNNIGDEGAKGLVLPPGLQILDLQNNHIGDEGAKGLMLPPQLKKLDIDENKIGAEGAKGLVLPSGLRLLNLEGNHINAEGAKVLKLPSQLYTLNLSYNHIDYVGLKVLKLPSGLQELYLGLKVSPERLKKLALPPGLEENIAECGSGFDYGYYYENAIYEFGMLETESFIRYMGVCQGKCFDRYVQAYPQFHKYFCKPFWMEICRGLMFGRTEDPIFQFLQSIPGARNIRKNIVSYANSFLPKQQTSNRKRSLCQSTLAINTKKLKC